MEQETFSPARRLYQYGANAWDTQAGVLNVHSDLVV